MAGGIGDAAAAAVSRAWRGEGEGFAVFDVVLGCMGSMTPVAISGMLFRVGEFRSVRGSGETWVSGLVGRFIFGRPFKMEDINASCCLKPS